MLWPVWSSSPASAQMAGAPAIPAFGAYFPAWLLCAALGIIGAVIARAIFIRLGLDDVLPWPLAVYTAIAVALAILSSSLLFGL
ncbi:YtcA family lipoprotein [Ancylobacter sp. G4_0304]|uniref:YtcA family lipoprotein n=1 Tax=Ancylobacter sp. G4_0304 TaxID=3114289 RepID=UPI0039C639FE